MTEQRLKNVMHNNWKYIEGWMVINNKVLFFNLPAICSSWRHQKISVTDIFGILWSVDQRGAHSLVSREFPAVFHCCCVPCWPASSFMASQQTPLSRPWTWVQHTLTTLYHRLRKKRHVSPLFAIFVQGPFPFVKKTLVCFITLSKWYLINTKKNWTELNWKELNLQCITSLFHPARQVILRLRGNNSWSEFRAHSSCFQLTSW